MWKNLFLFIVNIIKIFGDGDGFLHSHIFSQNIKIWSNTLLVTLKLVTKSPSPSMIVQKFRIFMHGIV